MVLGLSDGTIGLVDCAKAEVIRDKKVTDSGIKALVFTSTKDILVAANDLHMVSLSPKISIERTIKKSKKSNKN